MVRRREHDALDALPARRLEQIVAADDVGLQDVVPRAFDRKPAEMQDAVDALADRLDLCEIGQLGRLEFFVDAKIGGRLDDRSTADPDRSAATTFAGLCRLLPMRRSLRCVAFDPAFLQPNCGRRPAMIAN